MRRLFCLLMLMASLAWLASISAPIAWGQSKDQPGEQSQAPAAPQEPELENTSEAAEGDNEESTEEEDGSNEPIRFDRQNSVILQAIEPLKTHAEMVTVAVLSGSRNKYIALGTIVDSDGLILTKASELRGDLRCRLSDGRTLTATVYGIHQPTDLAMLKVDAGGLPTADWSDSEPPPVGYWLISPRPELKPKLGIVSVLPRQIPAPSGFMGVNLEQADNGIRVTRVLANSPAEKSGVLINDVIVALNGEPKTDRMDLVTSVQQHTVGEVVEITILRDDQEQKIKVKLADRTAIDPARDRSDIQNQMGGRLSKRRLGFPMAIQHDTTLAPNDCGGPVVDLTGQVIGLNIARAGRVDSLALPAKTILAVIETLRSGELAPQIIYKSEIEEIRHRLQEIETQMLAASETGPIETELQQDRIREDELQKAIGELQARLDQLKSRRLSNEQKLAQSETTSSELEKEKERLEFDLKRLESGVN